MTAVHQSLPSLVAVATGVLGSAWTSGSIASITLFGIPAALQFHQTTAQIWQALFDRGSAIMPKVAITVASSFAYAAYDTHARGGYWKGYLAAAGLTLGIVPFTLLTMMSTNNALNGVATQALSMSREGVEYLVQKWAYLNLLRSLLPLAGALTGLVTVMNNMQIFAQG